MKRRTKVKSVRLTVGELAAVKVASKKVGLGVGEWMRCRLLDGLTNLEESSLSERQLTLPVVRSLVPAPAGASKTPRKAARKVAR